MQTFLPTDSLGLMVTPSWRLNEVFRIEKLLKFLIFSGGAGSTQERVPG
jgi:hypothetical protein